MHQLTQSTYSTHSQLTQISDFGLKLRQIGDLKVQISVHYDDRRVRGKIYCNVIHKSPGFVPFSANLTHFGAKPDTAADLRTLSITLTAGIPVCLF